MVDIILIILGVILGLVLIFFLSIVVPFLITFYMPTRSKKKLAGYSLPPGKVYKKYKKEIFGSTKEVRGLPHKSVEIKSYDGLTLRGKYFECKKGAPIEILMHGYKGTAERDVSMGVLRCFEQNRNALLVDLRGCGYSDGHIVTFGVKESEDTLSWINFIIENIDKDAKIILTGISMGSATALITASKENLPSNVVGVIADCGFSSAEDIIKKIIKRIHLPVNYMYNILKLGARWFGKFDLDKANVVNAVKNIKLPVAFFHGMADTFVPYYMTEKVYAECVSKKKMLLVENAPHGMAYVMDMEGYKKNLDWLMSQSNKRETK